MPCICSALKLFSAPLANFSIPSRPGLPRIPTIRITTMICMRLLAALALAWVTSRAPAIEVAVVGDKAVILPGSDWLVEPAVLMASQPGSSAGSTSTNTLARQPNSSRLRSRSARARRRPTTCVARTR